MKAVSLSGFAAILGAALLVSPAAGAKEALGAFGDWAAFRETAGEKKCYIVSPPASTRASVKNIRRGAASLSVGIWPGKKVDGQVHAATGFSISAQEPVTLKVGGRSFTLLPDGESAWAESASADEAIVGALRRGSTAEVSSASTRGTQVTDRYSLKGFSAALDAARSACGGKNGG